MATLTPSLSIVANSSTASSSPGLQSDAISFTVSDSLTVTAPSAGVSRISTAANPIGAGAGVLIAEDTNQYYVYVKHLGVLASDGTTASHASNDFITLSDVDGTGGVIIKLQPSEFAWFPIKEGDGVDNGSGDGGLKVTAGSAAVMIEYGYWARG
tara:strand:- start:522 stop:986 length:465 start_codon:yes stop_codon:yes gene_type:complete